MIKNVVMAISMLVLVSCAGTNIRPDEYSPVATGKADLMPTKAQLAASRSKVVLFDVQDKVQHAAFSGMAIAMKGAVEKLLIDAGAETVDRSLATKLAEEINLVEAKGKGSYSGPAIAQFAIKPTIYSATIDSRFINASSWTDKKGKVHYTPPSCRYISTVKGTLNLYEVPSLNLVKAVTLEGSRTVNDRKYRWEHCPYSPSAVESLLIRAAERAVEKSRLDIQNEITPSAYVSERRRKGDEDEGEGIAVTTLGTTLGAKQGESVQVFRVENEVNPLTGKTSNRSYKIAEGKISSQFGPDYSWIVLKEGFEKVRIGHRIKIILKCGLTDVININMNCLKKILD